MSGVGRAKRIYRAEIYWTRLYSVTSRESFTIIRRHHSKVIRLKEEMHKAEETFLNAAAGDQLHYNTNSYSIILIGNKIDLGDQRVVTTEEGQESLAVHFMKSPQK
ncbi:hypothetical protein BDD12DRAFT_810557 [Trichophaea hybrida]|nr:hypothetical protein BDD12DRAFT_810557 [Trichophaea hybrida]